MTKIVMFLILLSGNAFGGYYVYHEEELNPNSGNGFCSGKTPRIFYALRNKGLAKKFEGGPTFVYGGIKGTHAYVDRSALTVPPCGAAPSIWEIDDTVPRKLWAGPKYSIVPPGGVNALVDTIRPPGLVIESSPGVFIVTEARRRDYKDPICKRLKKRCRAYRAGDENE